MGKRQEIRKRQQQAQKRNRLIIIVLVALGALLIASVLIFPNLKSSDPGEIVEITPISKEIPVNKTSMGNPDASVKIDVWEDFQCPGCLYYSEELEPQIVQNYVETGKVYYTFHNYPFIGGALGESHDAANAAMCAAAQERFWDYHSIIFANWLGENVGSYTKPRLTAFAEEIGLEMNSFKQCFQENAFSAQIQQDILEGEKLGVPPTPGIFVNGQVIVNSESENYIATYDDISTAIETALSEK